MGGAFTSFPKFSSDASKVVSCGAGLSKAFIGQKNTFTVDSSKAGENRGEADGFLTLLSVSDGVLFCRHQHADGRGPWSEDALRGGLRQAHGQQDVQRDVHSEGAGQLHPHRQVGGREHPRKSFPCHRLLEPVLHLILHQALKTFHFLDFLMFVLLQQMLAFYISLPYAM